MQPAGLALGWPALADMLLIPGLATLWTAWSKFVKQETLTVVSPLAELSAKIRASCAG